MPTYLTRRNLIGAAGVIAAAGAAVVVLPTATVQAAELVSQPAAGAPIVASVALCPAALKAALRNQEARARIADAEQAFRATLSDAQLRAWIAISDAKNGEDVS